MFIPSHLQRTKYGIFHFRLSIPSDLRCILGKREIKISLQTGVQSEAIHKSFELKANTVELFKHLRTKVMLRKVSKDFDLSLPEKRKEIIDYEYQRKFVQIIMKPLRFGSLPMETIQDDEKFSQALIDVYSIPTADNWFQEMIDSHQLKTEGSPVTLKIFKHEFSAMYQRFVKDSQKSFLNNPGTSYTPPRLKALVNQELADLIQQENPRANPLTITRATEPNEPTSILLSELISKFLTEKARDKSWSENTKNESQSIFDLIVKIIQDVPVSSIGNSQANDLKQTLLKLPKNMDKSPLYRSKTIEEIIGMKPKDILSVRTVNKKLGLISSLFLFGKRHGYVKENYFEGLCLKETGKASERRDAFDNSDLEKLFSSPIFTGKKPDKLFQYWLPLLGLYTGARLEELCQLYLEDIRKEKDVWVFDINSKKDTSLGNDKHLKNDHSVRLIPIHSKLIELGFLNYVESLRVEKVERVFPGLSKTQNKYGHAPSKWFGTYRKKCGVNEESKVFHSFRHTVLNLLKQNGIDIKQVEAISGHGDESMAFGTYGKAYGVSVLKGVIEILDFNEVLKGVVPFGKEKR